MRSRCEDEEDYDHGAVDTRFSGPPLDPLSKNAEYDPQIAGISSAYVSLFNVYVRRDLKYGEGRPICRRLNAWSAGAHWDIKHNGNPMN